MFTLYSKEYKNIELATKQKHDSFGNHQMINFCPDVRGPLWQFRFLDGSPIRNQWPKLLREFGLKIHRRQFFNWDDSRIVTWVDGHPFQVAHSSGISWMHRIGFGTWVVFGENRNQVHCLKVESQVTPSWYHSWGDYHRWRVKCNWHSQESVADWLMPWHELHAEFDGIPLKFQRTFIHEKHQAATMHFLGAIKSGEMSYFWGTHQSIECNKPNSSRSPKKQQKVSQKYRSFKNVVSWHAAVRSSLAEIKA